MTRTPLLLLTALPALVAPLQAQAPEVPLAQRLAAERPEIDKLLEAFQPKEALAKAEGLLPAQAPAWDKSEGNAQYRSYLAFNDLAKAYFLAHRAALAAGQWEKALDYGKKAQACMAENAKNVEELFPKIVEGYEARIKQNQAALKADEAYIKELRAKANPDAGDKQQLDLVAGMEKGIAEDEKWAKAFQGFIEAAKKNAGIYDPWVKAVEEKLKSEATQIEDYKAGKGDKAKWVEAIIAHPTYLATNYPDKGARLDFLFRLSVLAPENEKVSRQIDVELGKVPAAPVKATKGRKKG